MPETAASQLPDLSQRSTSLSLSFPIWAVRMPLGWASQRIMW